MSCSPRSPPGSCAGGARAAGALTAGPQGIELAKGEGPDAALTSAHVQEAVETKLTGELVRAMQATAATAAARAVGPEGLTWTEPGGGAPSTSTR